MAGHRDRLRVATGRVGVLGGRFVLRRQAREGRLARSARSPRASGAAGSVLALTLVLGLAAVALTGVALGALVDNVTDGDGIAVLDHLVARFVAAHRTPLLTSVMKAVSTAAGPAALTACALAAGLLLGAVWRSWTPALVLAATAAGAIGLTIVFKETLARPRPPLAHAVAAADGYGFPSGHAAAAAAVCGAFAWLQCPNTLMARPGRHLGRGGNPGHPRGRLPRVPRRPLGDRRNRRLDLRDLVAGGCRDRLGGHRPPPRSPTMSQASV